MLYRWDAATLLPLLFAGVVLDWLLGEARRWHPLVGFGKLAAACEHGLNRGRLRRWKGCAGWLLVVMPPVALCGLAAGEAGLWLHAVLLYFSLGLRSLRDHTRPIAQALEAEDLPAARMLVARIVSRDTAQASGGDLAKATVESLLENGNDAVFGTLFWFIVAGGPGALLFRLANTLDAMWGYRTSRFLEYGWAAARIDDALNWLPARLTAMSYALLGDTRRAYRCWRKQAPQWSSPNAGPVMAAGAGALCVELGGVATYDGVMELRPSLGNGSPAQPADIDRAWKLVMRSVYLWFIAVAVVAFLERILHA
jgi:adenosylcobinamide-phosphate synthase